jgi:hypothetical protein
MISFIAPHFGSKFQPEIHVKNQFNHFWMTGPYIRNYLAHMQRKCPTNMHPVQSICQPEDCFELDCCNLSPDVDKTLYYDRSIYSWCDSS